MNRVDQPRSCATMSGSKSLWMYRCFLMQQISMDLSWSSLLSSAIAELFWGVLQLNVAIVKIWWDLERPTFGLQRSEFFRPVEFRIDSSLVGYTTLSDQWDGWLARALTLDLLVNLCILFQIARIGDTARHTCVSSTVPYYLGRRTFPLSLWFDDHLQSYPVHSTESSICRRSPSELQTTRKKIVWLFSWGSPSSRLAVFSFRRALRVGCGPMPHTAVWEGEWLCGTRQPCLLTLLHQYHPWLPKYR